MEWKQNRLIIVLTDDISGSLERQQKVFDYTVNFDKADSRTTTVEVTGFDWVSVWPTLCQDR